MSADRISQLAIEKIRSGLDKIRAVPPGVDPAGRSMALGMASYMVETMYRAGAIDEATYDGFKDEIELLIAEGE